jgi:phage-related protein
MKPLEFLGSSRDDLCAMPDSVRHDIGLELMRVQFGGEPKNFKPMHRGCRCQIRVRDESGATKIYVASSGPLSRAARFQKKTQRTANGIELAKARYSMIGGKS